MTLNDRTHFAKTRTHKTAIMYPPPPTPRSRNALLTVTIVLATLNLGKTQDLTLQPLPSYEASLREFHTQRRDAARIEYQQTNRKKWWYYLPNLGIGLAYPISQSDRNGTSTLTTRARLAPTLNLGTSTLATIDQSRNQTRAKLAAIDADAQLQYRIELHELRNRYQAIVLEQENVAAQQEAARLETSLFSITEEANRKKEIKPSEYQQAQLLYQKQQLQHATEKHSLHLKIIDLERFARYRFPEETLDEPQEIERLLLDHG